MYVFLSVGAVGISTCLLRNKIFIFKLDKCFPEQFYKNDLETFHSKLTL